MARRMLEGIPAPYEVLYGMNPVREALIAGRRKFRRLYASRREDSPEMKSLLAIAKEKTVSPVTVEREELEALVHSAALTEAGAQGVAMVVTPYRYYSLEEIAGTKGEQRRQLLALDEIEDPRNLGAMARTAEAAGFRGLLLQEHRAAAVTPVAAKASAGAVEHLRIARETNLSDSLQRLKEQGYWICGLDADPAVASIYDADLDMDLVLVVGAEGKGLRPRVRSNCDLLVRLPMAGKVGSLNASAAAAAAIWQVLRASRSGLR
jgi:23S rRNA (guanosine2251-2'-O)-methyltransferase